MEEIITKEYCQSCGAELSGKFCSNCGEKKFDHRELTFGKIVMQAIDGFTHFDSKIFKSIKLLIVNPGLLAKEYCQGRRVNYAKPIQLFFIINVVFFLMLSFVGVNTFTTPLSAQIKSFAYSRIAESIVEQKLLKYEISPEEYEKKFEEYSKEYDHKVNLYSKSLIVIISPLFALVLQLLFINKRRLYAENLIFSLNFLTWLLLILILIQIILLPAKFLHLDIQGSINDNILSIIVFISIGVYSFYGVQRFYNEKKWLALVKCLLLPYLFLWVLNAYRLILFLITYYTT